MPKIKRHVLEAIFVRIPGLGDEAVDEVAQVAFVLGLGLEFLRRHFDDVGCGVVADAGEFDQFVALGDCEEGRGEVGGRDFYHDFVRGGVVFAHVGGVAEAERGGERGWGEAFGEFYK